MSELIVLDTSIIVSAMIGTAGPSRQVLRRCFEGAYVPLISNALFQEYEAVTSRASIKRQCPLTGAEVRDLLNSVYGISQWIPIYYLWRPNLPDEADNFLIELAAAGNSALIVSNNLRDLVSELKFPEIQVMNPEQFLHGDRHGNFNH